MCVCVYLFVSGCVCVFVCLFVCIQIKKEYHILVHFQSFNLPHSAALPQFVLILVIQTVALLDVAVFLERIQRLHLLGQVSSLRQQSDDLFGITLILVIHECIVNLFPKFLWPIQAGIVAAEVL